MNIRDEIHSFCSGDAFQGEVASLLEKLCEIDTTCTGDLAAVKESERRIFHVIEDELEKTALPGSRAERRGIPRSIQDHPAYTIPSYAVQADGKCSADDVYEGRCNLLYLVDRPSSPDGLGTAVNAHVDVVSPFIGPRRSGDFLYGRGTADDKGNIAGAIGALRVLRFLEERKHISLKNSLTAMFVIDEEIGGNGSLALAVDRSLRKRYDSLMVLECTGNVVHPSNRGAVYVKAEAALDAHSAPAAAAGVSLAESFCYALLALKREADNIRMESDHPLFPERPVYMCPGILGPYGAHPSSICGEIEFLLRAVSSNQSVESLSAIIDEGLAAYIADFGDKTRERDPRTGEPRVRRHYDISRGEEGSFLVSVHGTTGHLGALPQNDPAIMKWAYMAHALVERRIKGELFFRLALPESGTDHRLAFEGAQGFIPTHTIEAVKGRMRRAFLRGISSYLDRVKAPGSAVTCDVTFNKLHNNAYTCDVGSPSIQRALQAARESGTIGGGDVSGWNASCDGRLFANEHPSLPVITCGAGELGRAHSTEERVSLPQLFRMVEFTALFLLRETGSVT
jgi:acetylornithine deacetylase/succinyl-diaminopimelate desuccinylase-like protein